MHASDVSLSCILMHPASKSETIKTVRQFNVDQFSHLCIAQDDGKSRKKTEPGAGFAVIER
ncbi:hypothetical protein QFZ94_002615 [Paraburkholderia sp. JPY465]|uniref:hypothetical protein n=1 Tax=Paraburkholderia sp. JPY465 TaxID=3042285 RepID=UPI003D25A78D